METSFSRCRDGVTMPPSILFSFRRVCGAALVFFAVVPGLPRQVATAAESFPYNEELLLDARPMKGSKRVPMLEIRADGAVLIDLWCNSVEGQIVVADDTITILTSAKTDRPCTAERERGDQNVLSALEQVTNWRRDGDSLILIGPQKLRFRRLTN